MATVPEFSPTQNPAPSGQMRLWGALGFFFFLIALRGAIVLSDIHQRAQAKHPVPIWHHEGTIARPDQLSGSGRIYLVQLGVHNDPYTVVGLAEWLRDKYALDVQILPAMGID